MSQPSMSYREYALTKLRIPCLIFIKLKSNCGACSSFMPIWERLAKDPVFKGKVGFVAISIGVDPQTGKVHRVPKRYESVVDGYDTVPLFLIDTPDGDVIDLGGGPPGRSFDSMKNTLIQALSDTPFAL